MPTGYFALVLHAHLPFVRHPEDPTVMEEQWLYEGITGTYLPLLQRFEGLVADGVPYRCTVSLSAPLIAMLTDDLLKERYAPGQPRNPATDPRLRASFHAEDLAGKAACKAALQAEAGLPVRPDVPLLAVIARLVSQKGVDVLAHALDTVLAWDVQMVVMGSGDPEAEAFFLSRARTRGDRLCAWVPFDDARSHRIQAGADFFVMPSRFEPCGLSQLCAMRYGTLPIVRATGGLVDTVTTYEEPTGDGTGFMFHDLRPDSLADTIGWAVSTWYHRPAQIE